MVKKLAKVIIDHIMQYYGIPKLLIINSKFSFILKF